MGVEPTYLVWKTSTFATRPRAQKRKERELNPQGSSLGRFRDGCHRQLACPSVQAAAAGIEPAIVSLTGSRLTIGNPHTARKSGRWDFEPTLSGSRNRRIPRAFLRPEEEHPAENPNPGTSCMASREATATSRVQSGDPEGLEPSPRWLRARYAAANTWIPFGPEGVEPSSGPYKEPALAVELRANGAGGS